MIIRLADPARDALQIMNGARDFVKRIGFSDLLPDDESALTEAVARIVALDGLEIIVAEHDGNLVAGIGLLYAPYLWNPRLTVADELFWWASAAAPFGAAMKVICEAVDRIKKKGAIPVFRSLETSPAGVGRLYARLGLRPVEKVFMGQKV